MPLILKGPGLRYRQYPLEGMARNIIIKCDAETNVQSELKYTGHEGAENVSNDKTEELRDSCILYMVLIY